LIKRLECFRVWWFALIVFVIFIYHGHGLAMAVQPTQADRARQLVRSAIEAMGGELKLRQLKTVRLKGFLLVNHLQDSEHPSGPFVPDRVQYIEIRDFENRRLQRVSETVFAGSGNKFKVTSINADSLEATVFTGNDGQTSTRMAPSSNAWYEQSPERALLLALMANDLRVGPDMIAQSVPHRIVDFTFEGRPVRLFLNASNKFLTAVEVVRDFPYDVARRVWGDVKLRVTYSNWDLEPGGIHYPLQFDTEFNGMPLSLNIIDEVALNVPAPPETFQIDPKSKDHKLPLADDLPLGRPDRPITEIAPKVIQIPGSWYSTIVRQSDGLVIIEAPISSGYSQKVIAEAERRFPGVPLKAVITTNNFWWHLAGIREYVARGIDVYALDSNKNLVEQVIAAPHHFTPDALDRAPKKAKLHFVSGKLILGAGDNRLELYPIRAATSQMMMVYFPQHQLLYTSEQAQPLGPGGSFLYPHDLANLMTSVNQERLKVDRIIGMHMSPTPWRKLVETVEHVAGESQVEN